MKKNICLSLEKDGIGCKHPRHDGVCRGKCKDFEEDLEDLYTDIDDRQKSQMTF